MSQVLPSPLFGSMLMFRMLFGIDLLHFWLFPQEVAITRPLNSNPDQREKEKT